MTEEQRYASHAYIHVRGQGTQGFGPAVAAAGAYIHGAFLDNVGGWVVVLERDCLPGMLERLVSAAMLSGFVEVGHGDHLRFTLSELEELIEKKDKENT